MHLDPTQDFSSVVGPVVTRRVPPRNKSIHHDVGQLPHIDPNKEYSAADIVTGAMKVFARDSRVISIDSDLATTSGLEAGVAAVDPAGADKFNGSLLVQIGPVRLVLDGEIAVTSRDDASRRASLRANAKDSRVGGTVRSTVDLTLRDVPQGCELSIDSDVQIGGRIGEFGQPVIQRKADQMLAQFAACLGRTAAG